jgi:hypothetical protein
MQKKHRNTLIAFFVLYGLTFLPNFNIFNNLIWIGPLPQPLFWVLIVNFVNTMIIIYVYKKFFKPFAKRIEEEEELERGNSK